MSYTADTKPLTGTYTPDTEPSGSFSNDTEPSGSSTNDTEPSPQELIINGSFTGNANSWTLAGGWAYNSNNVTYTP